MSRQVAWVTVLLLAALATSAGLAAGADATTHVDAGSVERATGGAAAATNTTAANTTSNESGNATAPNGTGLTEVAFGGPAAIAGNYTGLLWANQPVNLTVEVTALQTENAYELCAYRLTDSGETEQLACDDSHVQPGNRTTVVLSLGSFATNSSSTQTFYVELRPLSINDSVTFDTVVRDVTFLAEDGDYDGDGLTNAEESARGLDLTDADMDGDGLDDGAELKHNASPTNPDTDGDGLRDAIEVQAGTAPDDPDTDGDGLADGTERDWGTDPLDSDTPWILGLGGLLTALVVAAIGYRWVDGSGRDPADTPGTASGVGAANASVASGTGDGNPQPRPADESRPPQEDDTTTGTPESGDDGGDRTPDPDLLSDDDQVLRLLETNGGRMRQSNIVEETGWSKAKVSRLLSRMADEGQVEKLQLGRENIIALGDEDDAGFE